MRFVISLAAVVSCLIGSFADLSPASACTGITIKARDGSVVFARTLEFAVDPKSDVVLIPRDMPFIGSAPGARLGLRWRSKYAMAGMNGFDLPVIADGFNEKGLHVGIFYFPGFAKFQPVTEQELSQTLGPVELPTYLLGMCANVDEAADALKQIKVAEVVVQEFGFVPPFHYVATDASGKSIAIEYVNGELKLHANPFGVMTNSPTFDWHMTNLSNYVTLSDMNVEKLDLAGKTILPLGQGSGMLGLPGDFTPPSRFVRAVAFSKTALPVDDARGGVLQAFHLLNQFDIPKGSARGLENGKQVCDYTLWTSASDLKNLRYYFRTYDNSRIRMVDLKAFDLDGAKMKTVSIGGEEQVEDLSPR